MPPFCLTYPVRMRDRRTGLIDSFVSSYAGSTDKQVATCSAICNSDCVSSWGEEEMLGILGELLDITASRRIGGRWHRPKKPLGTCLPQPPLFLKGIGVVTGCQCLPTSYLSVVVVFDYQTGHPRWTNERSDRSLGSFTPHLTSRSPPCVRFQPSMASRSMTGHWSVQDNIFVRESVQSQCRVSIVPSSGLLHLG